MTLCQATAATTGQQCRNRAASGDAFCWQHAGVNSPVHLRKRGFLYEPAAGSSVPGRAYVALSPGGTVEMDLDQEMPENAHFWAGWMLRWATGWLTGNRTIAEGPNYYLASNCEIGRAAICAHALAELARDRGGIVLSVLGGLCFCEYEPRIVSGLPLQVRDAVHAVTFEACADRRVLASGLHLAAGWPNGCRLEDDPGWQQLEESLRAAYGELDDVGVNELVGKREQHAAGVFRSYRNEVKT